jgi:hypothetical protein
MGDGSRGWQRQPGESPEGWLSRLQAVDQKSLRIRGAAVLQKTKGQAEKIVKTRARQGMNPGPSKGLGVDLIAVGPLTVDRSGIGTETPTALDRCEDMIRVLSGVDRRQLVLWVSSGMPDGRERE